MNAIFHAWKLRRKYKIDCQVLSHTETGNRESNMK